MTKKNQLSRRQFIQLSATATAATLMTHCQPEPSGPIRQIDQALPIEATEATEAIKQIDTMENTGKSKKIIVVGAGMAGLAAARTLNNAGFAVTVLEGRDRIGGRVWTSHKWADAPMDLGASWIHGIRGNPITALADEVGVPRQVTDYDNGVLFDMDGRELSDQAWDRYEEISEQITDAVEKAQSLNQDSSIEAAIASHIDLEALSAEDRRYLSHVLNATYEQEWSGSISQLSAKIIDEEEGFGGNDVIFPEGYGALPAYLASGLDIQLEQIVQRISHDETGVTVVTQNGEFQADRVLVTLPLGVLKSGKILFDPPLPQEKQSAIQQMGVGVLNKVYLRFAEPFWEKQPEWLAYLSENRGEWSEWFNIYHYVDQPILLAFNAADFGTALEAWTDEEIIEEAMNVLHTIFNDDIPDPESVQITRWIADPFAKGSYSFPAVGAPANARDILAQPVGNRLFFAGEATSSDYPSTVHGAYMSGLREAERIQEL